MTKKLSKLETKRIIKAGSGTTQFIKSQALEDGSVYFEGWANKAVVDRGGDLITKGEWMLDDYKKNAVILFNHDHTQPVGKAMAIEAQDGGLYIKGRIANSNDPSISRIRDLVKEGVLNSLSVGIAVGDVERTEKANVLKKVQLHEVSIVAVPMNQDSQISLTAKSMAVSPFESFELIAKESGHDDVAIVLGILKASSSDAKTLDEVAEKLSAEAGIEKSEALEFLKMDKPETPTLVKEWMVKTEMVDQTKGMADIELQAIKVPKALADSADAAKALAEGTNWDVTNVTEEGDFWILLQKPVDAFDGELRSIDLGKGITATVGELKGAADDAPGSSADNPVPMKPAPDDAVAAKSSEDVEEKGLLDEQGIAQPLPEGIPQSAEVTPTLDQMKQTNVLLASVVSLLQQISQKFDTLAGKPEAEPDVTIAPEAPIAPKANDPEEEIVKMVQDFVSKTNERLSRLSV